MPAPTLTKSTRPYDVVMDLFVGVDKNGDGTLSRDEVKELFKDLGWKQSPAEAMALFRSIDTNGDGLVDIKEFMSWIFGANAEIGQDVLGSAAECKIVMVKFQKQLERDGQSLADVFDEFADENGFLHRDHVFEMFRTNGDYSESILNGIFELFDWNKDNKIDETEFLETFDKHIRDATKVARQERCRYTTLYNPDSDLVLGAQSP